MPVKNPGNFLVECLDSILNQTLSNWELLAVNDHSSDNSLDILNRYAHQDDRIHVFNNEGEGIIAALRTARSHALADHITRMDSDDVMLPDKLSCLNDLLLKNGREHVAVGCVAYFSADNLGDGYKKYALWLNHLTRTGNNYSDIYKECVIPSPCWMIHREDLEACGGFSSDIYPEDYDLCFRFYKAGFKIAGTPKILHKWRDYPHRTSRTHEHYADNRFLELKLKYFLELDYNSDLDLVVWGAGKKGKWIAKELISQSVDFTWISNNKNKIGHAINGQIIQGPDKIKDLSLAQVIVAVANPREQNELITHLGSFGNNFFIYSFC